MSLLRTSLTFGGGAICGIALGFVVLSQPVSRDGPPGEVELAESTASLGFSAPARMGKTRIVFSVSDAERAHIQTQMLGFLIDLQSLNEAIASSDRDWIEEIAARQARQPAAGGMGLQVRKRAPEGFTQISQSLRNSFGELEGAAAAEPIDALQLRLSRVMERCVSCLGTYATNDLAAH